MAGVTRSQREIERTICIQSSVTTLVKTARAVRWGALSGALMLALLTPLSPASAQEPLWGEVASTLGKGFAYVTAGAGIFDYKPYAHHGGPVLLKIDRLEAVTAVEYGLQSDLDLRVNLPYVMQTIKESFGGQSIEQDINSMGEMTIGSRWRFRQAITASHKDELALLAGLKLPTGP